MFAIKRKVGLFMRKFHWFFFGLLFISLLTFGCAINLPFNNRPAYLTVKSAKDISSDFKGPIVLKWIPPTFPERIDVQGASGFSGGGSQTRIPTGVGLASRILELLDVSIGVNDSSEEVLTISVLEAKSEFEFSANLLNLSNAIDVGKCVFEAEFLFGDKKWNEIFTAEMRDPTVGGTSQTGVLEKVWDDIALQVVRSVIQHIR
jgi:hypothetical protein